VKPYEKKDGDGALFKNEDKRSEKHPDYKGNIRIGGRDYWLSAWLKSSKAGAKYLSLAAQPKGESRPVTQVTAPDPEFNDPIPF
jgi:uncharacterized protein (DUF736 family)